MESSTKRVIVENKNTKLLTKFPTNIQNVTLTTNKQNIRQTDFLINKNTSRFV